MWFGNLGAGTYAHYVDYYSPSQNSQQIKYMLP